MAEQTPQQQHAAQRRAIRTERRNRAAALAAGRTLPAPAVAAAKVPSAEVKAAAVAAILAALLRFHVDQAQASATWLSQHLPSSGVKADDIARVIADEVQREQDFAANQAARLSTGLGDALSLADASARESAVAGIMAKEQNYARQRVEASAARAFAAVERVVLKGDSPAGAFWKLDPDVSEHTKGCLRMGGRFWPWQVLNRVHPPRHAGCPCRLLGFGEAVDAGLMRPTDVQDVAAAIKAAAGVGME